MVIRNTVVSMVMVAGISVAGESWAQSEDSEFEDSEFEDSEFEDLGEGSESSEDEEIVVDMSQGIQFDLSMTIYGNVGLVYDNDAETSLGFAIGALGTVFNADIGEGVQALAEIAFEDGIDGPVSDIERVQIRMTRGEYYVEAGRTHTEIGYWNTAYHHSVWSQLPVNRPVVLSFEDGGGLLPVHHIGASVGVDRPIGDGLMHLAAGVSNGRGDFVDNVPTSGDNGLAKALLLSGNLQSVLVEDLTVGGSFFYDKIAQSVARTRLPQASIDEVIVNAHAAYNGSKLIGVAEVFDIIHSARGETWQTMSAFALAGYEVIEDIVPYTIVEVGLVPDSSNPDPFFTPCNLGSPCALRPASETPQANFTQIAIGTRYRVGESNVLKLEYSLRVVDGEDTHNTVSLDWSFGI